nr:hypothetical protein 71 [bacterium]
MITYNCYIEFEEILYDLGYTELSNHHFHKDGITISLYIEDCIQDLGPGWCRYDPKRGRHKRLVDDLNIVESELQEYIIFNAELFV